MVVAARQDTASTCDPETLVEPRSHVLDPDRLADHIDRLYRAAWALCGSHQDAEDLVQDTYACVLRRPRIVRGDADVYYLLRALRNTFISQRRAVARRPPAADIALDELELPDTGGDAADPAAAAEACEVYAAIAALPDEFRDALVAIDVAGLSYREAARLLRVREGTITSRVYRARGRVADSIRAQDGSAGLRRSER
jgi:RNA polymerase sigma-70 factor (ECF subfamily)